MQLMKLTIDFEAIFCIVLLTPLLSAFLYLWNQFNKVLDIIIDIGIYNTGKKVPCKCIKRIVFKFLLHPSNVNNYVYRIYC